MRRLTALIMLLALVASACQIRTDVTLEINADESGTLGFELGFDREFRQFAESEGGSGEFSFDGFDDLAGNAPDGWSATDFDDGQFAGTRISTPFSSLADLDAQLREIEAGQSDDPTSNLFDMMSVTRNGDTYTFEATLSQLDQALADAGSEGFDFGLDPAQFLEDIFVIRFLVTMPGEITSHNADQVEGSTAIWQIPLNVQTTTLRASSGPGGGFGIVPILITVAGLAILGLLGMTVMRRRQEVAVLYEPPSFTPNEDEPTAPVGADPFSR